MGLELPPDFPTISAVRPQSGAKSGAPGDDPAILTDAETDPRTSTGPASDPLLKRFLDAWERLSDDDRLRVVEEAVRLAEGS